MSSAVTGHPAGHRTQSPAVTWLGHATVLVELDHARLVTDPVLRRHVGPLVRITSPVPGGAAGTVDGVLLSHLHADHADLPTLRTIDRRGPLLAPAGAGEWLRARGMRDVREMVPGAALRVAGVTVEATPAVHSGRRTPLGPRAGTVGYLLQGSRSVYFAGDTDLFAEMADLRGRVDVALVPVWGWGPSVGAGHLDPQRAAAAVARIAPALAIPIHWGTLALPRPARRAGDPAVPARAFAERVHEVAPGVEVRLLAPGERLEIDRRSPRSDDAGEAGRCDGGR